MATRQTFGERNDA